MRQTAHDIGYQCDLLLLTVINHLQFLKSPNTRWRRFRYSSPTLAGPSEPNSQTLLNPWLEMEQETGPAFPLKLQRLRLPPIFIRFVIVDFRARIRVRYNLCLRNLKVCGCATHSQNSHFNSAAHVRFFQEIVSF
jgi:hypothetical protein